MKTYTDEEINTLIDELQKELPEILKAEAATNAEGLAKSASGTVYPTAKEGGNGTTPEVKGNTNMSKGAASFAKADESKPASEPADDEGGSDDAAPSPSPDGPPADASSAPAGASPSPSPSPAPDASASPAGAVDPMAAAGAQDPAMAGAGADQGGQLEQAYAALSDDELKAHMQALTASVMARMGAQDQGLMGAGAPAADPMGGSPAAAGPAMPEMAPPAGPDASASMSPPPAPAQKAMPAPAAPQMLKAAPAPGMVVKSERAAKEETLSKASEERIQGLEKTLEGVTSLLEAILTKPVQRSVTSMAEYIAKSESDKPATRKMSRAELMKAATEKSKQPDLKKSERDVINKFVLSGEGLADLEKLLKE